MLLADDMRALVVRPALRHIKLFSPAAENLVMGTLIQESCLTYLHPQSGNFGLGVAQIEPATFGWLWHDYLRKNEPLKFLLKEMVGEWREPWNLSLELITNLSFASAMCFVRYLPASEPLPEPDDLEALGKYWETHYRLANADGTALTWVSGYIAHAK